MKMKHICLSLCALLLWQITQAQFAGYVKVSGRDSPGNDIRKVELIVGIEMVLLQCNNDPKCVGFNSGGYLKSRILGPSKLQTSTYQLYIRQEVQEYTMLSGVDSIGGDLPPQDSSLTPDQMKDKCNNDANCAGFNTLGWFKQSILPKNSLTSAQNNDLYVKGSLDLGYYFYQGSDISGNDIRSTGETSVGRLRELCNMDLKCVGFNTLGVLKSKISPRNEWQRFSKDPTQGLYIMDQFNDFGYLKSTSNDSPGNNIAQYPGESVESLRNRCDADRTCIGFNTLGWLKNRVVGRKSWSSAAFDLYVKRRPEEYTTFTGLDIPGYDIGAQRKDQSADQLRSLCNDDLNCVGFNSLGYLKNYLLPATWTRSSSTDIFIRGKLEQNFYFHQGFDSTGGDIKTITGELSIQVLRNLCLKDPKCVGFNSMGTLKSSIRPRNEWEQFSTYSRHGLYVLNRFDQVPYSETRGSFFEGYEIRRGPMNFDMADRINQCNNDRSCVGYTNGYITSDTSALSLKSKIPSKSNILLGRTSSWLGIKGGDEEYTLFSNLTSPGYSMPLQQTGKSVDELKAICNADMNCVGFSTDGFLKTNLVTRSKWTSSESDFYVRGKLDQDYQFRQGYDSGAGDLRDCGETSVDVLKLLCNLEPACVGFNTAGWLKSSLQSPYNWERTTSERFTGLYVKVRAS